MRTRPTPAAADREPVAAQLSLFDGLGSAIAGAVAAVAAAAGFERAPLGGPAPAPSSPAFPSPSPSASPSPSPSRPPLAAGAPPSAPSGERRIVLDGQIVGYRLRRGRRRTIGFVIALDGLTVSAPRWVTVREIEAALQGKARWILRKLAEQRDRARRLAAARIEWRDGAVVPFLGESVVVALDARAGATARTMVLDTDPAAPAGVPRLTLRIGLGPEPQPGQIRDAVQSWLQRQARRLFEERVAHFAPRLGVRPRRLALSSAQTRWGSASADGSIRLNWRLIHFPIATIDYVVAHELAHLREMNHSPRFWDVVRSVLPDYEDTRGALKDRALPSFDD